MSVVMPIPDGEAYLQIPEVVNITEMTVDRHVARGRGARAAIYAESGEFTFAELQAAVNRCGNALRQLGVRSGQHVSVHLPFSPEAAIAILGAMKIGAVPVMTNTLLVTDELRELINHSDAVGVITSSELLRQHGTVLSGVGFLVLADKGEDVPPGALAWSDFLALGSETLAAEPTRAGDPAYMIYTSGSTGTPKGVIRPHRVIIGGGDPNCYALMRLTPDDVCYYPTRDVSASYPSTHGFLFPLYAGAAIVIDSGREGRTFSAERVLGVIQRYKVTVFAAVPTMYRYILSAAGVEKRYDTSSVRIWTCAGENLAPATLAEWEQRFGRPILSSFGQAEASTFLGHMPDIPIKPGSLGKPFPGMRAVVVDEYGRELPDNEEGQLALPADSPNLALGYYKRPELWAQTQRNGWYLTGDLVYRDEDGYFWWVGRADEMFKSRGYKIIPREIEQVLMRHPAVRDGGVLGVPSPEKGYSVVACVSLRPGYQPSDALAEELREHVRRALVPYKVPERIVFFDELPKAAMGKVNRRQLYELYERTVRPS